MADTPDTLARLTIQRGAAPKRKPRWRKWVILAVIVVIVMAAVVLAPRQPQVQVTSVLTSYPSQQYAVLTASGYVVAQRRAAVSSKATGRLDYLAVTEGSRVKAGDLIARLDARDVTAVLASARANVQVAQAAVAQARVELQNAQAELTRAEGLVKQGFVTASTLDTAKARVDRARAAVDSALAGVKAGQANEQAQRVNQDFTEIRAPFDGVVLVKSANIGDIITPFSSAAGSQGAVVTMADMSTLEVEADVSESSLSKVTVGMPVEITLDALPDARFRGTVSRIVPTVDRAKATVMTKIRFEALDPRILPEMSAKVTMLSKPINDADQQAQLAVNPQAIVQRDGRDAVLRIGKDDVLELVPVTRGASLGDAIAVTGAVKSGDKLVLAPTDKLQTGTKVALAKK
jgi:RND family efflux transporter MFP subunit